jgi:hypothetical protein
MRIRAVIPVLTLTALAALLGCGDRTIDRLRGDSDTLAVVGRYSVSVQDFDEALKMAEAGEGADDVLKSRIWDRLLNDALILNETFPQGEAEGEIVPLLSAGTPLKRQEIIDSTLQDRVYAKISISEQDLVRYYEDHSEEFQRGRGYLLQQILVTNETQAEDAIRLLRKDQPFEDVARLYSISPERGAPLYFEDEELPEYLVPVLQGLKQGGDSRPICVAPETYQVVRLKMRARSYTLPLEEVAIRIRMQLTDRTADTLQDGYMAEVRRRHRVTLFHDKFPFKYQEEIQ